MKSYSSLLRVLAACALASLTASFASAFEGKVDMKMTAGRGEDDIAFTYFVKGSRMRTEFTPSDKKGDSAETFATIIDWKTREMTMLMPEQKMYMVHTIPEQTMQKAAGKNSDVDFKPTGRKEKIAGIEAEEYAGVSEGKRTEIWVTKELGRFMMANQGKDGPMGKKNAGSAWQAFAEQGDFFALRVIQRKKEGSPETFRMEVTKVDRRSQPDSLFKPPADYEKFEMPSMGGMFKGMIPGR